MTTKCQPSNVVHCHVTNYRQREDSRDHCKQLKIDLALNRTSLNVHNFSSVGPTTLCFCLEDSGQMVCSNPKFGTGQNFLIKRYFCQKQPKINIMKGLSLCFKNQRLYWTGTHVLLVGPMELSYGRSKMLLGPLHFESTVRVYSKCANNVQYTLLSHYYFLYHTYKSISV